jgi:hypothetical protein
MKPRQLLIILALITVLLIAGWKSQTLVDEQNEELLDRARLTANGLVTKIGSLLMKELAKGDTAQAISVCADTAQAMTRQLQREKNVYARRISEKWRNPKNMPDSYEKQVLERFALMKRNGSLQAATEHYEIVNEDTVKVFRYLKAILVQQFCLQCHGSVDQMSPQVTKRLQEHYPWDRATGYAAGDLRGAVSVKIAVE